MHERKLILCFMLNVWSYRGLVLCEGNAPITDYRTADIWITSTDQQDSSNIVDYEPEAIVDKTVINVRNNATEEYSNTNPTDGHTELIEAVTEAYATNILTESGEDATAGYGVSTQVVTEDIPKSKEGTTESLDCEGNTEKSDDHSNMGGATLEHQTVTPGNIYSDMGPSDSGVDPGEPTIEPERGMTKDDENEPGHTLYPSDDSTDIEATENIKESLTDLVTQYEGVTQELLTAEEEIVRTPGEPTIAPVRGTTEDDENEPGHTLYPSDDSTDIEATEHIKESPTDVVTQYEDVTQELLTAEEKIVRTPSTISTISQNTTPNQGIQPSTVMIAVEVQRSNAVVFSLSMTIDQFTAEFERRLRESIANAANNYCSHNSCDGHSKKRRAATTSTLFTTADVGILPGYPRANSNNGTDVAMYLTMAAGGASGASGICLSGAILVAIISSEETAISNALGVGLSSILRYNVASTPTETAKLPVAEKSASWIIALAVIGALVLLAVTSAVVLQSVKKSKKKTRTLAPITKLSLDEDKVLQNDTSRDLWYACPSPQRAFLNKRNLAYQVDSSTPTLKYCAPYSTAFVGDELPPPSYSTLPPVD